MAEETMGYEMGGGGFGRGGVQLYEVEGLLMKHKKTYHQDHERRVRKALSLAREQLGKRDFSNAVESPFLKQGGDNNGKCAGKEGIDWLAFTQDILDGRRGSKSEIYGEIQRIHDETINLPEFNMYVSLSQNRIAENNDELQYWPTFSNDEETLARVKDGLYEDLQESFNLRCDEQVEFIRVVEHCKEFEVYAERFISDVGCSWKAILVEFLRQGSKNAKRLGYIKANEDSKGGSSGRVEDFDKEYEYWKVLLEYCERVKDDELEIAGLACRAYLKVMGISLWHLVRRKVAYMGIGDVVDEGGEVVKELEQGKDSEADFSGLACEICHVHFCTVHGENRDESDGDSDGESSSSSTRSSRSCGERVKRWTVKRMKEESRERYKKWGLLEKRGMMYAKSRRINNKSLITKSGEWAKGMNNGDVNGSNSTGLQRRAWNTSLNYSVRFSQTSLLHERGPLVPCSHTGKCEQSSNCSCYEQGVLCEKFCQCDSACRYRFTGCSCSSTAGNNSSGAGGICWNDKNCDCFNLNRECDPDMCKGCLCKETLDWHGTGSRDKPVCENVNLQRDVPKKMFIGASQVHGIGLFAGENVKMGDFLGEYKGEIVSSKEAIRRGVVYHHYRTLYLFSLNMRQEIDSTKRGNKFRFINHSSRDENINCVPKVLFCNGVYRIGFFAKRNIVAGEELFFNYGCCSSNEQEAFWEKGESPFRMAKKSCEMSITARQNEA